jgi:hypothetical protein
MKLKLGVLTSVCSLALLAGSLSFSVGNASALPLWPGYTDKAGTQYTDHDIDFWTDTNGTGKIDQTDVLTAVISFDKAYQLDSAGNQISPYTPLNESKDELVALVTLQVKNVFTDGAMEMEQVGNTPMVQFYTLGGSNILGDAWSDSGALTLAQATAAVTDGTPLWQFSVTNDPDTFWIFQPVVGVPANDPSIVSTLPTDTTVGNINYALNQVGGSDFNSIYNPLNYVSNENGTGYIAPGGDGLVGLTGTGTIQGGSGLGLNPGDTGYDPNATYAFARSKADVSLNPVPEPTTMALFGFGLMGLGLIGRRRSRK